MRTFVYNIGYFLLEANRTIRYNPLSNFFSVVGTGLILFLLGCVLTGWSVGDELVTALQKEAEVSAYFSNSIKEEQAISLADTIRSIKGVKEVRYIDREEAYTLNKDLLGEEAGILELFNNNPFEAYLEISINLDDMDQVLTDVTATSGIEYVRDNRDVLVKMKGIVDGLKILGIMLAAAVGITTLIIISHMIRQGIYNNKEQINTLRLLGAPSSFIGFPFVLAGTLLTLLGGILAAGLLILILNNGYHQLSGSIMFLPMPTLEELKDKISLIILAISICLGILGSLFGLSSIRRTNN